MAASDSNNLQPFSTTKQNNAQNADGLFVWRQDTLLAATEAVNGVWNDSDISDDLSVQHATPIATTRIITDTRKLEAGDIFLALIGDNFDGHQFLDVAAQKGAVAAIVSRSAMANLTTKPQMALLQLAVDDTRLALGQLAAYRRQQHSHLKVIAITGSSGKTTVKEMLRAIFKAAESKQQRSQSNFSNRLSSNAQGYRTLITRGNLNNDLGVPMMLLELSDNHHYAVLELGANHLGEIAYTANIAQPDVACILNIGTAHLGEFGGQENIATAKAEIYQSLSKQGTAVVPFDDDYHNKLRLTATQYTNNVIHFGWQDGMLTKQDLPKVYASEVDSTSQHSTFYLHFEAPCAAHSTVNTPNSPLDKIAIKLPVPGIHNVSNALAAAACAYAIGLLPDVIATGLSQVVTSKGRLHKQQWGRHQLIDDTYNANPNSVRAAADVLAAQSGVKVLVLGDIAELGESARAEHIELGAAIAAKDIDWLLCVGEHGSATVSGALAHGMRQAQAFDTKQELLRHLYRFVNPNSLDPNTLDPNNFIPNKLASPSYTFLFKGSRSATMETLIEALTQTDNLSTID